MCSEFFKKVMEIHHTAEEDGLDNADILPQSLATPSKATKKAGPVQRRPGVPVAKNGKVSDSKRIPNVL